MINCKEFQVTDQTSGSLKEEPCCILSGREKLQPALNGLCEELGRFSEPFGDNQHLV